MKTTKTRLALGVAGVALTASLGSPALAACATSGSTVTCTADSTAAEVNAAMAAVVGDDVTLSIATDANVVQPTSDIFPTQQGTVEIANAGDVGTDVARVNVIYVGSVAQGAANTFALTNTGSVSGSVSVFNVGGATTIDNSGSIGNGLTISTSGTGAVTVNSAGDIDADGPTGVLVSTRGDVDVSIAGNVGTTATDTTASDLKDIQVFGVQTVTPAPVVVVTVDGTATTTTTTNAALSVTRLGGTVSVALEEGANSGAITANGLGGSTVAVDGTVGSETDYQNVNANSSNFDQTRTTVSTVDGADFAVSDTTVRTAVGGEVAIAVGETGSVSGNVNANGAGGAAVSIDGSVGTEAAIANASATSSNFDRTTVSTNQQDGTLGSSTFSQDTQSVGGIASVAVGETGSVAGGVNANGVGGAAIAIEGTVGLEDAPSFANQAQLTQQGKSGHGGVATMGDLPGWGEELQLERRAFRAGYKGSLRQPHLRGYRLLLRRTQRIGLQHHAGGIATLLAIDKSIDYAYLHFSVPVGDFSMFAPRDHPRMAARLPA